MGCSLSLRRGISEAQGSGCCCRGRSGKEKECRGEGRHRMKGWRPQWASALPRSAVVLHDLAMVWLSWNGLTLVRYALAGTPVPLPPLWSAETVVVLLAQGLVLWRVGLYRGLWRFASVPDLLNLAKAGLFGVIAIGLGLFLYNRLDDVPRTVLLMYPFALVGLLGAPRLLYRAWKEHALARNHSASVRVLILGAGRAGEALSLIHISEPTRLLSISYAV